jgi:serine/threonine protein phosphatase 1
MLSGIFTTPRKSRLRTALAPPGTRIYAIGDIHGRVDLLRATHERILADAQHSTARRKLVIYLGDYIDRGLESRQVIDLLLDEPLPGFQPVYLKGNHEKALLDFLNDVSVATEWFFYGGDATLYSYKVTRPTPGGGPQALLQVQADLMAKLPERHLSFYQSLAPYHCEGDYLFVHAGLKPGVPIEKQSEDDLLWIRDEFLRSDADHGYLVVHGHTISPRPEVKSNRIGIDTGAYATGRLTCLRIEEDEREFLGPS